MDRVLQWHPSRTLSTKRCKELVIFSFQGREVPVLRLELATNKARVALREVLAKVVGMGWVHHFFLAVTNI